MNSRHVQLTDDLLKRTLAERAGRADDQLLADTLAGLRAAAQRRPWWWALTETWRRPLAVLALLAITGAVAWFVVAARPPRNGELVLAGNQVCGLTAVDTVSGTTRQLVPSPPGCREGSYALTYRVALSADSSQLAYSVSRLCGGCSSKPSQAQLEATGLWLLRVGTGEPRLVTRCADGFCGDPDVSADGSRLAITPSNGGPIQLLAADGKLLAMFDGATLSFSPDGAVIAVHEGTTLRVLTTAGVEIASSQQPQVGVLEPVWSPDSGKIAFFADDGNDRSAVVVIDKALSRPIVVDRGIQFVYSGGNTALVWSGDSRQLIYASSRPMPANQYAVTIRATAADGSSTREIYSSAPYSAPYSTLWIGSIAVSPDGRELAFSLGSDTNAIDAGTFLIGIDGGTVTRLPAPDPRGWPRELVWLTQP